MAKSLNEVRLIGNLGGDPEIRYTTKGTQCATFSMATTERMKEGDEWKEFTEWHRVVCWAKLAELAEQYLRKGRGVHVSGRLHTRSWDSNGETRYATEVVADDLIFLGGHDGDQRQQPASQGGNDSKKTPRDKSK